MPFKNRILGPVINLVLPPRCPICGDIVGEDGKFCLACWRQLEFLREPWCESCGRPFAYERQRDMVCADCLVQPPDHDGVRAVVRYDDVSALIPMRLKYGMRLGMADLIAGQLAPFAAELPRDTVIVPVPLHRRRLWSRGFNQSVLIGRALSRGTGLPMHLDVIQRIRATPPLRAMPPEKRRKTVRNAFAPAKSAAIIESRPAILVDDVYTSGATANACARLLKKAGATKVLLFCWARVLGELEAD